MRAFVGRLFFICFGLSIAWLAPKLFLLDRIETTRLPAAVPKGRLDFRALDMDAVPRAITNRVMAEARVVETARGPQLVLGHFRSTLADGSVLDLCEAYGSLEATFEGLGKVADGSEPIQVRVQYPCRPAGSSGGTTLASIAIPIGQLGQSKPRPMDLNWSESGDTVSIQVRGEADIWPDYFTLKEIRLLANNRANETIVLDRGLIARQTKSPLDFRMFTATRTAGE